MERSIGCRFVPLMGEGFSEQELPLGALTLASLAVLDKAARSAPMQTAKETRIMAIPVFRPTVKRKDMGSVLSCIVSDKIGPGEISRELVTRAATCLGMRAA